MAKQSRADIKTNFETGDIPTQQQFSDFIDSMVNQVDDQFNVVETGTTPRFGLGTATPLATLDVNGNIRSFGLQIPSRAQAGRVLTSDASGNATWQDATGGGGGGEIGTLQEVTDQGSTTGLTIQTAGLITIGDDDENTNSVFNNADNNPILRIGNDRSTIAYEKLSVQAVESRDTLFEVLNQSSEKAISADNEGNASLSEGLLNTDLVNARAAINGGLNINSDSSNSGGYKLNVDNGLAGETNGIAGLYANGSRLLFDFKSSSGAAQLVMNDRNDNPAITLKSNNTSTFDKGIQTTQFEVIGTSTTATENALFTDSDGGELLKISNDGKVNVGGTLTIDNASGPALKFDARAATAGTTNLMFRLKDAAQVPIFTVLDQGSIRLKENWVNFEEPNRRVIINRAPTGAALNVASTGSILGQFATYQAGGDISVLVTAQGAVQFFHIPEFRDDAQAQASGQVRRGSLYTVIGDNTLRIRKS